jgi:subtilisin-like proprotein convertase family protein
VGTNLGEIPRGNPGGRDVLFDVTGKTGVVTGVTVQFTLSPEHTYATDLSVALIAPDNTTAQIFRMVPLASADLGGPYTFQDSATGHLSVAALALSGEVQVPSGSYRAENNGTQILLNTVFAGKAPNGTWKLRFIDDNIFDTGTVSQASLTLTLSPTTASPGKTSIEPQPNGHMTLNLTAAAPNANYDLQRSTDLQNWTLLQSKTTNASGANK